MYKNKLSFIYKKYGNINGILIRYYITVLQVNAKMNLKMPKYSLHTFRLAI